MIFLDTMVNIQRTNFDGDPNLGLHTEPTEDLCIVDPGLSKKCYRRIRDVLGVEVLKTTVAGSSMPGIFCAANSNGVALPKNTEEEEKEFFDNHGIEWKILEAKHTALGNLIMVNDSACVVSQRLMDSKKDLENLFGVPVVSGSIAGRDLLGSSSVVTNRGLLTHRDTTESEMEYLEEIFDLECGIGTVGFGVPFVGACIVANTEGILISEDTTGPEMGRIQQALEQNL